MLTDIEKMVWATAFTQALLTAEKGWDDSDKADHAAGEAERALFTFRAFKSDAGTFYKVSQQEILDSEDNTSAPLGCWGPGTGRRSRPPAR